MMRRREFLATTAALAAAPRIAWAQEKRRLAILVQSASRSALFKRCSDVPCNIRADDESGWYALVIETLEEYGWIEWQNVVIERYSAEGNADLIPGLAQAVANSGPDLILAQSGAAIDAIMAATDTIPVVSRMGQEQIERYAESLARPGRNLTGPANSAGTGLLAKRLQLLHEVVPSMKRVAFMDTNRGWATRNENPIRRALMEYADQIGITVVPLPFDRPGDEEMFRRLFASLADAPVDALLVTAAARLSKELKALIVRLANDAGLPSIYAVGRQFAELGGLMYYATDIPNQYRRAAWYVDQILNGADPGELPIEQPTIYDFIINLKTAKEIGIEFPLTILYRATEVIE